RRRFSDGYRVTLTLPPGVRASTSNALVLTGAAVEPKPDGLVARSPVLTPLLLDELQELADANGGTHVTIERPEMTDVFRRLMLAGQDPAAPAPAPTPVVASAPAAAPSTLAERRTEASNAMR